MPSGPDAQVAPAPAPSLINHLDPIETEDTAPGPSLINHRDPWPIETEDTSLLRSESYLMGDGDGFDHIPPVIEYPLLLFYFVMIVTILVRTFDGNDPYVDYSRPVTFGAGVFEAGYNGCFLGFSLLQICRSHGGERWTLMKKRQKAARNSFIVLTAAAIGALCVLDLAIIAVLGQTTKAFVQLVSNACGYTACFLIWLGPPRHPLRGQIGHLIFGLVMATMKVYQLSAITNQSQHFEVMYTLHTFVEFLVIYELGHLVLGSQYFHFKPLPSEA